MVQQDVVTQERRRQGNAQALLLAMSDGRQIDQSYHDKDTSHCDIVDKDKNIYRVAIAEEAYVERRRRLRIHAPTGHTMWNKRKSFQEYLQTT